MSGLYIPDFYLLNLVCYGRAKDIKFSRQKCSQGEEILPSDKAQFVTGSLHINIQTTSAYQFIIAFRRRILMELTNPLGCQDSTKSSLSAPSHQSIDRLGRFAFSFFRTEEMCL